MPSAMDPTKDKISSGISGKGSLSLTLAWPFHKEPVQKYKEASAIFKYSPSLSVLCRYNCLLMFQLLSLFLSLFHGREISEARNFGARSIPNLATNFEVNFLRSEEFEPPVNLKTNEIKINKNHFVVTLFQSRPIMCVSPTPSFCLLPFIPSLSSLVSLSSSFFSMLRQRMVWSSSG